MPARRHEPPSANLCYPGSVAIKFLGLALSLCLGACRTVEVQDYVHEPTHKLRQSIVNSSLQRIDGIQDRRLVVVPNFRTFSPSYVANRAVLIIVSVGATTVQMDGAKLVNKDTGATQDIDLNEVCEVAKSVPKTGYFLGFVSLLKEDFDGFSAFNQAQELELTVTYRLADGQSVTETILLKRVVRKKTAWST